MRTNKNIKLNIKNVRCFAEEQQFDIRPLTFLVGENSTGKTTVMACFSVIMDCVSGRLNPADFNREPYLMGSFQDIATKESEDPKKNKTHFEIGYELESNYKCNIHFTEQKKSAEPIIQKVEMTLAGVVFSLDNEGNLEIKKETEELFNEKIEGLTNLRRSILYYFLEDPYFLYYFTRRNERERRYKESSTRVADSRIDRLKEILDKIIKPLEKSRTRSLSRVGRFYRRSFSEVISLAPIRSKPKRTYDPIRGIPDPEGSEIPVTLMRLSGEKRDWEDTHRKLIRFGKASGLFSDLTVKKYGESIGEPFQLQLEVRGFRSNIMDIGYGVGQILPLLVRLFYPKSDIKNRRSSENHFLLQQPEVHLHPKAQAELASLLVKGIERDSFLIETHSDYMIDRVRIEIRRGNLSPDDVSLIYLEATKKGVKAHNISFDKEGNLKGVPKGYRDFFINESDRFLGFED